MIERIGETIVAISSPPGCGTVGIVRLSGPNAIPFAVDLAGGALSTVIRTSPGGVRLVGEVRIAGGLWVPAAFLIFRGPGSYTGQDMVEIHTVGSRSALEMIREQAVDCGALAATPGEFTARAFLNGKMDLAQAEAVAGTIHAESDHQLRAARRMMAGSLTKSVKQARDELAELLALVEAEIDFAEEPIEFIRPELLRNHLDSLRSSINGLAMAGPTVEQLTQLPHILLVGPPNAGKSTLMNRLCGMDRAICSAVSGTTRDVLSAPMRMGRGEAILLDAAGIDASRDPLIAAGRTNALLSAQQVELVCLVVDVAESTTTTVKQLADRLELSTVMIAANKRDLEDADQVSMCIRDWSRATGGRVVAISAKTGAGVEELREAMNEALDGQVPSVADGVTLLTQRQRDGIVEAASALGRARQLADSADETVDCDVDLLAFELREALDALGSVTGEVTTDDLLTHVFANFCIGK